MMCLFDGNIIPDRGCACSSVAAELAQTKAKLSTKVHSTKATRLTRNAESSSIGKKNVSAWSKWQSIENKQK